MFFTQTLDINLLFELLESDLLLFRNVRPLTIISPPFKTSFIPICAKEKLTCEINIIVIINYIPRNLGLYNKLHNNIMRVYVETLVFMHI